MKLTPTLGGAYSGSVGGLTASHNKGGQYFRRRSVPTNPNTSRQQLVRSLVGSLTQSWSTTLTEAQRQAWRDYAANTPFTDTLGQTIQMSGLNAYVKSNLINQQWTASIGTIAPTLVAAPTIFNTGEPIVDVSGFSGVFTTPPGTVTITAQVADPLGDDGDVFVFIAPPQTAGTRYYKGPFQLATVVPSSVLVFPLWTIAADLSDPLEWQSDTVPVAGWDGLFVPLRLVVRLDDGRVSETWMGLVPFVDATP